VLTRLISKNNPKPKNLFFLKKKDVAADSGGSKKKFTRMVGLRLPLTALLSSPVLSPHFETSSIRGLPLCLPPSDPP
jgi:hypothetical protein